MNCGNYLLIFQISVLWAAMMLIFLSTIVALIIHALNKVKVENLKFVALLNGYIEISMFAFAMYHHFPQFVGFWIGVKVALIWFRKPLKDAPKAENELNKKTYLNFLIGNALVIIFSYLTACLVKGEFIIFNV